MANLGAVGYSLSAPISVSIAFAGRALAKISGTGATARSLIVISLRSAQVAATRADGAGAWVLSGGLNDGTYWAAESGTLRAWLVEVAGATVTVTLQTGGGGGGDTIIAGHAWACVG